MIVAVTLCPRRATFAPMLYTGQLEYGLRRAAELGCDGVEFNIQDPTKMDVKALAQQVASLGLRVTGLGTGQAYLEEGLSLADPTPEVRAAVRARLQAQVDLATRVGGAAVILGGIRGRFDGPQETWPAQRAAAVETARAVADYAAMHKVILLVEPINRYEANFVNSVDEALALIEEIGSDNVHLLIDTFHMNIEEPSLAESIRTAGPRLAYVHLVDSNRWAAGFGHTDFDTVFSALHEIGYDGPVCAEVLPLPDDDTAIRQHVRFVRAHW
ncbi:MAG: sugar phosphate isomerase/epimerase family protein [Chloroflexota bacterium]|nr:sugar phosphate isomerase/epimerase family protein [Chloroflexota bacterium]